MRSFNEFIEHQNIGPLIEKAARLMAELEIDPEEYLTLLMENPAYQNGVSSMATGASQVVRGAGTLGQGLAGAAKGAVQGAYSTAGQAGSALANSAAGQGAKGWWQSFQSADRKVERAKSLLTKAMSDPHMQPFSTLLTGIIQELNHIAVETKKTRLAAQQPQQQTQPQQQPPMNP